MFERFTDRAKKVMALANQEAQRLKSEYIGTEHVLLGLVKEGSGVGANVLRNLEADLRAIRTEIEKTAKQAGHAVNMGKLPQTPKAKKVIEYAIEEARNLNHNYIGTEHILLGLLRERQGKAVLVLDALGVKIERVRDEVLSLLGDGAAIEEAGDGEGGGAAPQKKGKKSGTPALDSYGRDLTEMARDGRLDPVIGRRTEIERVVQILCRRQKNNPVLLGEAGVGKTAIVEGLAQKIIAGDIPQLLSGRRIVCLDLAMMVAGTKYRGQFEERIKAVMGEVRKARNVILFIDEMHTLIGAGGAEGAIDAANVLKPALSRGEIQCIGATTLTEYRKYIEKDSALERRFQKIMVEPPNRDETLAIIKGLRDRYEAHHRVRFPDASVALAVELADRFISGRVQPDKTIDVIDEAGSRMRLRMTTKPPEVAGIDGEIDRLTREKREAVENSEFERAAELRDALDTAVLSKKSAEKGWEDRQGREDTFVGEDVIAEVVSSITGVPLTRLSRDEAVRLLGLEAELHKSVISQDEAVSAIAKSVRRSRSGLKDPNRPMGSFIFVGPSGVGKTYLAKRLAEFMFGDPDALLVLDMSEYMEKHNVSRLIGAPPGYVGYEEGGQLTEFIRRRPYSIVLFDEVEKAHPDTFNMLLQIMEEGRLTDSFGRHVDFKNTIIIMTSNIGAHKITHQDGFGFQKRSGDVDYEKMKETLRVELESALRPEFLNRLDEVIVFRKLTHDDLVRIVDLEVAKVAARLRGKGLSLELTQGAKDFLVEKGTDEKFGARPLRRAIGAHLEDSLSEAILRGDFAGQAKVLADVAGDGDGRKLILIGREAAPEAAPG